MDINDINGWLSGTINTNNWWFSTAMFEHQRASRVDFGTLPHLRSKNRSIEETPQEATNQLGVSTAPNEPFQRSTVFFNRRTWRTWDKAKLMAQLPGASFSKWGFLQIRATQYWMVFGEIPSRNGWWLGVPLWLRKAPNSILLSIPSSNLASVWELTFSWSRFLLQTPFVWLVKKHQFWSLLCRFDFEFFLPIPKGNNSPSLIDRSEFPKYSQFNHMIWWLDPWRNPRNRRWIPSSTPIYGLPSSVNRFV